MSDLIRPLQSNRLSTFRTHNIFYHYADVTTVEEFRCCLDYAKQHGLDYYILGNGSNTLFATKAIKTLVIKNKLKREFDELEGYRIQANSSLPIAVLLRYCLRNKLDCFYYLASVPATVGGAIAMNAGRGRSHKLSVFDYLESVTFFNGQEIVTQSADTIKTDYRWTPFTGTNNYFILSAVFCFPPISAKNFSTIKDKHSINEGEPEHNKTRIGNDFILCEEDLQCNVPDKIRERVEYSKQVQDHSAPNCGSVFKQSNPRVINLIRGLKFAGAKFSKKTPNWLLNQSPSSRGLVMLIRIAKAIHRIAGSRAVLEIIKIK